MKRDRIKIARESNLVLANREAAIRPPSGEDLSGESVWAALRAANEKVGTIANCLILEYLYNKVRTAFLKNS